MLSRGALRSEHRPNLLSSLRLFPPRRAGSASPTGCILSLLVPLASPAPTHPACRLKRAALVAPATVPQRWQRPGLPRGQSQAARQAPGHHPGCRSCLRAPASRSMACGLGPRWPGRSPAPAGWTWKCSPRTSCGRKALTSPRSPILIRYLRPWPPTPVSCGCQAGTMILPPRRQLVADSGRAWGPCHPALGIQMNREHSAQIKCKHSLGGFLFLSLLSTQCQGQNRQPCFLFCRVRCTFLSFLALWTWPLDSNVEGGLPPNPALEWYPLFTSCSWHFSSYRNRSKGLTPTSFPRSIISRLSRQLSNVSREKFKKIFYPA